MLIKQHIPLRRTSPKPQPLIRRVAKGATAGVAGGLVLLALGTAERGFVAAQRRRRVRRSRGGHLQPAASPSSGAAMISDPLGTGLNLGYCALLGGTYGALRRDAPVPNVWQALTIAIVSSLAVDSSRRLVALGRGLREHTPLDEPILPLAAQLLLGIATAAAIRETE